MWFVLRLVYAGQGLDASAPRDAPTAMVEGMRGKAWSYTKTAAAPAAQADAADDRAHYPLPASSSFSEATSATATTVATLPFKLEACGQRVNLPDAVRGTQSDRARALSPATATTSGSMQHTTNQDSQSNDTVDDVDGVDVDDNEIEQMEAAAAFIDELDTDTDSSSDSSSG